MDIYSDRKDLLRYIVFSEKFLYSNFPSKYRKSNVSKKNGGIRTIRKPVNELKKVQRNILDKIIKNASIPIYLYGLIKGRDHKANAIFHSNNFKRYVYSIDIADFFGSIHYKSIKMVYQQLGFSKENSNILTRLSTIDKLLPQGSPLSTHLASLAFRSIDRKIIKICQRKKLSYSRYVDDIVISGAGIDQRTIRRINIIIHNGRFAINRSKERLYGPNDTKIVNNIKIVSKNCVTATDPFVSELERLIANNDSDHTKTILGKMQYFRYLNKQEAQKFQSKFPNFKYK